EGALCFVSHDVHFIRSVARRVVRIEAGVVSDFPGDWDYYCWRRASGSAELSDGDRPWAKLAAAEPAERSSSLAAASPATADGRLDRSGPGLRLEGRRAAETRAARARRLRPLRDEARRLEAEIDDLEREKAGVEADLADPASYGDVVGFDPGAL